MEIHSASGQEAIGESLQRYCSTEGTPPLLLFPEEDTTNGRAGLLKFRLVLTFQLQDIIYIVMSFGLILMTLVVKRNSDLIKSVTNYHSSSTAL